MGASKGSDGSFNCEFVIKKRRASDDNQGIEKKVKGCTPQSYHTNPTISYNMYVKSRTFDYALSMMLTVRLGKSSTSFRWSRSMPSSHVQFCAWMGIGNG